MKRVILILTVLNLLFSFFGCDNGSTDDGSSGKGKLTIIDIPAEHIDKYIGGYVDSTTTELLKFTAKIPPTSSQGNIGVKITGNSVSLNVYQWKPGITPGYAGYGGSDTIPAVGFVGDKGSIRFLIQNNEIFESRGGHFIHINPFTFNNGSATLSFSDLIYYPF